MRRNLAELVNVLNVCAVVAILLIASLLQFILSELPCPLCLLQRLGLLSMSIGFLMNLRFGVKPMHYALSMLSALFAAAVAVRQILLHILPGSGIYGDPVLGLSLYAWVFIIAVGFMVWIIILLIIDKPVHRPLPAQGGWLSLFVYFAFAIVLIIVGINLVTTFLECGLMQCPENPIHYRY